MQPKVSVVCLKYGKKYSSEYVNKLYNMVKRNLSIPYEFVCITEDRCDLNTDIKIIDLDIHEDISGWWYKPFIFNRNLELQETVLFLDLDLVIFESIDKLFDYKKDKFCVIKGFSKENATGINSSCFRFNRRNYYHLYDDYIKNYTDIIRKYKGDQDWLSEQISSEYWPKEWIQSFKIDILKYKGYISEKNINSLKHMINYEPNFNKETCMVVFHGKPNPHEIETKWVRDNWR